MRAKYRGRRGKKLPVHLQLPPHPSGRDWSERTIEWWEDAVTSPMGTRYTRADLHGLVVAFVIIDEFYVQASADMTARGAIGRLTMLATEARQQIARYGLTPRDRLSLHWAIAADPEEQDRRGPAPTPTPIDDYRAALG